MRILITGTSSGIGRYLAEHLAAGGNELWGLARSVQADFERMLHGKQFRFRSARCDVSDWEQVARVRAEAGREWESLDALICCSGVQSPIGPATSCDPVAWSRNIRVNLDGTFFPIRAFHDLLVTSPQRGKVICFSGGGSTSPRPNFSAYAAAKCAVVRLVETLSHEWQTEAIDINAVAPGAIYTKMTEETIARGPGCAGEKEYAAALELKKKGDAPMQKVGALVDYLLSPASDGISGRLISAPWDPWSNLAEHKEQLKQSDIFTLRRITPEDRGGKWG